MKQQRMRFVNNHSGGSGVPPIKGQVVTSSLTFSSLLTESGLHWQHGGVATRSQGADRLHDLYLLTAPSCYNCQSQD